MTVGETASAATGARLAAAVAGTFTIKADAGASHAAAAATPIPADGSEGGGTWAAVEAYYICHDSILAPDLSAWDSISAQYWATIGVPAGIVFGTLGAWAWQGARWVRELLAQSPPA